MNRGSAKPSYAKLVLGMKLFAVIRVAAHKDQAQRSFE